MNLSKHSNMFVGGTACKVSKQVPGSEVNPRSSASSSTFASSVRRRPSTSCVARTGFQNKLSAKTQALDDYCDKFSAHGRSSDPNFREHGSTSKSTQASGSKDVQKPLDDGLIDGVQRYYGKLAAEKALDTARPRWTLSITSPDQLADLLGGGEGSTDGNDDDDDGFDDDDDGLPQAMQEARTKTDLTMLSAKEAKRSEHCAIMEEIARTVSPDSMENYLKSKGFFNHNYNSHARTTMSKQNLKIGKKKGIERLMQLLTFS